MPADVVVRYRRDHSRQRQYLGWPVGQGGEVVGVLLQPRERV